MVRFPRGLRLEGLRRDHPRTRFASGQPAVDAWLHGQAWQSQTKHLSTTRVLVDHEDAITGFFSLATGQVEFGDLPADLVKKLPRRAMPVAVLAWLSASALDAMIGPDFGQRT